MQDAFPKIQTLSLNKSIHSQKAARKGISRSVLKSNPQSIFRSNRPSLLIPSEKVEPRQTQKIYAAPVTLLILLLAPSPKTCTLPSCSKLLTASANSAPSTGTELLSLNVLTTSPYLALPFPPRRRSSSTPKSPALRSSLLFLSLALVPSVSNPISIKPVRASVAACLRADWMRRTDSSTSRSSTVDERRILACASDRRIMLSSWRVVAVMRRSAARMSSPSLRMAT